VTAALCKVIGTITGEEPDQASLGRILRLAAAGKIGISQA